MVVIKFFCGHSYRCYLPVGIAGVCPNFLADFKHFGESSRSNRGQFIKRGGGVVLVTDIHRCISETILSEYKVCMVTRIIVVCKKLSSFISVNFTISYRLDSNRNCFFLLNTCKYKCVSVMSFIL